MFKKLKSRALKKKEKVAAVSFKLRDAASGESSGEFVEIRLKDPDLGPANNVDSTHYELQAQRDRRLLQSLRRVRYCRKAKRVLLVVALLVLCLCLFTLYDQRG